MTFSKGFAIKKIAIHSVPRSGSTWLGQIFNSNPYVAYRYQPLFSYAFKDRLSQNSNLEEINLFYQDLLNTKDKFVLQMEEGNLSNKYLEFYKEPKVTHVVYKEVRYHHIIDNLLMTDKDLIVIGLIRNPLAVINSWLKSPKEFRFDLGWEIRQEWRTGKSKNQNKIEEFFGFDNWKYVSNLFIRLNEEYPENFYLLRYDDLLKDAYQSVSQLFSYVGLEIGSTTRDFLIESRTQNDNDTYGVFKNHKADVDWKNNLDIQIISEIENDLTNTKLEQFLY